MEHVRSTGGVPLLTPKKAEASPTTHESSPRHLSLRWKTLIGLSIVLVLVNSALAAFAYRQLIDQFNRQQTELQQGQVRQMESVLERRYQNMQRLASFVPMLAPNAPGESVEQHLRRALSDSAIVLDIEWDIRTIHWVAADGTQSLLWPSMGEDASLPPSLLRRIDELPETESKIIDCSDNCFQYLAKPFLEHGNAVGFLVLGRWLSDSLLDFSAITGAEIAILPSNSTPPTPGSFRVGPFSAVSHPDESLPLFKRALKQGVVPARPVLLESNDHWFEVSRPKTLPQGITVLILNEVTEGREAISRATRNSILIGLVGLILSEGLLLLIIRQPLARVRRISGLLPLLAEQRFQELNHSIPKPYKSLLWRDEMDLMLESVTTLSHRMERMELERAEAKDGLVWLAHHDPLTKLLNRRRFNQELQRILEDSRIDGNDGALLYIDLDRFKDVNDISGHHMGDRLLVQVSEQLSDCTAERAILGRLGGDEFAMIMPSGTLDQAIAMATMVQQRIHNVVIHSNTWRHQVSASIGIVAFPQHGLDVQQLMADADLAMYQAKEKGRGRWHLFSPQDQGRERANARVIWAERIAAALSDDRYELHFQPILEIATGKVWRAEALLRMRDPEGQLVLPFAFIPIAEETGQIQAIDHWVLHNAISLLQHHRELSLSINLSANALQDPSLLPDIERLLDEYGVDPGKLTFEVTETVAISSLKNAIRLMQSIQALGCRFALDDFGSGYASYAYLRELPVDDVKIDGAFIRDIAYSKEDQIFVRAVTEMAHGMNKRVIAEFVENEEIVTVLREIGVDFAQGYHIGIPASPGADTKNVNLNSTIALAGR